MTPPFKHPLVRAAAAFAGAVTLALVAPGSALAHAVPGIDYRFPIPVWLYALGAGIAVLGTALAVAVSAVPGEGARGRDVYSRLRPLRVGALGLLLTSVLFFLAVTALVSTLEPGGVGAVARRYAPTLIPIAAVYFVSHYFLYLVYAGQLTGGAVLDPFGKEWVADYEPWKAVPGAAVWYTQVVLIVWGHLVAVLAAQRTALAVHERPRRALVAHAPLVLHMVAYTFTGLWVLGQVLEPLG